MSRSVLAVTLLSLGIAFGGEYRGKFTPDAEYVLSGQLARDLPPLPKVPFHFVKDGFAADRISKVPPVGVHPRVVLSPEDIVAIQKKIALGEKAGNVFRVILRDLHNKAAQKDPYRHDYGGAPWAGIDPVACKAILAHLTADAKLGREAVDWTMKHARFLEPRIDILNTHPEAAAWKPNFYYWSRTGVKVGGVDYRQAYEEGGAKRIAELAKKGVTFFGEDNQYAYTSLGAEYDYAHKFMTDAERAYVRKIIHKSTFGKYTTGMEIPGHFFINNHMSMGAEFLTLILAIEGEEGYDPRVLEVYAPRLVDKMTYDISPDGILYENVKGFIPLHPIFAAGRRGDRTHLRHSHLLAMMTAKFANTQCVYNRYIKRGRGRPGHRPSDLATLPEEPRYWTVGTGSGPGGDASFAWSWVLKHLYPKDPVVD
ncbi:hypothetical protein HQ560_00255, partial [bacterium]|nr:hypothetical protein [bacterium]